MMARKHVSPEMRKRTAQACIKCQRRKQKCDGKTPCGTCIRRRQDCKYGPRRFSDISGNTDGSEADSGSGSGSGSPGSRSLIDQAPDSRTPFPLRSQSVKSEDAIEQKYSSLNGPDSSMEQGVATGEDEEIEVSGQYRALLDPAGRLQFIGESATLSYLHDVRTMIHSIVKESRFTNDPCQVNITEATVPDPRPDQQPHVLPGWSATAILVESFFTHTNGLVDVLNRSIFEQTLAHCHREPFSIEHLDFCLIYLVLAIGLIMASPTPNSREQAVLHSLGDPVNRAEQFFMNAKRFGDAALKLGDADLKSVQCLYLMSVYALVASRRLEAYTLHGLAVRSAYSLGLHKVGDFMAPFDKMAPYHSELRRNLWRSLFVLDRFLAMSLGRPLAISEGDCTEDSLRVPIEGSGIAKSLDGRRAINDRLDAAVQASQVIGRTLKLVYSEQKISSSVVQSVVNGCNMRLQQMDLAPKTHEPFRGNITPAERMAILQAKLLEQHSKILLTRPFFSYVWTRILKNRRGKKIFYRSQPRVDKLARACITASVETIALIHSSFRATGLPQRSPFVLYFLFAATLIVLSNQFARIYANPNYKECIDNSIKIMEHCAKSDPLAKRYSFIATSFRDEVLGHEKAPQSKSHPKPTTRSGGPRKSAPVPRDPPQAQSSVFYNFGEKPRDASDSPQSNPGYSFAAALPPIVQPHLGFQNRPAAGFASGFASGPPEQIPAVFMVSPESAHSPASQIQVSSSGRLGNESAGSDLSAGEHRLGLWDIPHNSSLQIDCNMSGLSHAPPMPAGIQGCENLGYPPYYPYGISSGIHVTANQVHGAVVETNFPMHHHCPPNQPSFPCVAAKEHSKP